MWMPPFRAQLRMCIGNNLCQNISSLHTIHLWVLLLQPTWKMKVSCHDIFCLTIKPGPSMKILYVTNFTSKLLDCYEDTVF